MPNKTASQTQCKVAVSFQWERLEFPLVCDAVLPWVHHLSRRIFTIWGRDVIWSNIQRPSENPQCTKKTQFHGVKQTQLAVLIRVGVISCQKLYSSSERLVSTRQGSGALQGRPGQVSFFRGVDQAQSMSLLIQLLSALPLENWKNIDCRRAMITSASE